MHSQKLVGALAQRLITKESCPYKHLQNVFFSLLGFNCIVSLVDDHLAPSLMSVGCQVMTDLFMQAFN